MKNHLVKKHSVVIGGHKTSVSLEQPFMKSARRGNGVCLKDRKSSETFVATSRNKQIDKFG